MRESTARAPATDRAPSDAWVEAPVFVTGLMKTGSTLLLALLDGHPDVLAYPDEPSFHRLFVREHRDAAHRQKDWLFGTPNPLHFARLVESDVLSPLGFDPKSRTALPADAPTERLDVRALSERVRLRGLEAADQRDAFDASAYHESLAKRLGAVRDPSPRQFVTATALALADALVTPARPKAWLFKHPFPHYDEAALSWFFEQFPKGRMVVIVRDPRGYLNSQIRYASERRKRKTGRLWRTAYTLGRLAHLERDYAAFDALAREHDASRVIYVRYEDLITDTERTVRRLADELGIPFDPVLLEPTKLGRPVRVPTATAPDGSRVYGESRDKWRHELPRPSILLAEAALLPWFDADPGRRELVHPRPLVAAVRASIRPLLGLARRADSARRGRRKP